jgi:hypothetical protein
MGTLEKEDLDWEQLARTNWKGLGLTDPIKSIDVRIISSNHKLAHKLPRTNGSCSPLSSK